LMPLQQGSDSRWLHPHIYDWPREGSESGVAMLPVLNWTAARASDVVVQVLTEWARLASDEKVTLYCNAPHPIQIRNLRYICRACSLDPSGVRWPCSIFPPSTPARSAIS
jgi:hypothetical protein